MLSNQILLREITYKFFYLSVFTKNLECEKVEFQIYCYVIYSIRLVLPAFSRVTKYLLVSRESVSLRGQQLIWISYQNLTR